MINKIGFWPVFALVVGSQIGAGVFMLPANLAAYGFYAVLGWIISGCGAVALALVFGSLCARFPETGGPHVYVKHMFGLPAAFFTGWTYWVISWVSTTAVIVTGVGYLTPFIVALIAHPGQIIYLLVEIILLAAITVLNLKGVQAAGNTEFVLTVLKFVPLLIVPFLALFYFDITNFVMDPTTTANLTTPTILGRVALLALWGFIGLESATTPAGSVENPSKTIPRAIILGTLSVAFLYIINSLGIMGLIPGADLMHSQAPYVDAVQRIFGGSWHLVIALVASIACVGTLNAWVLTSGQIALGLAQDNLMPRFFARKNAGGAPLWGIIISDLGILPLLFFTASESLTKQVMDIIDFSVVAFLFVYLICCMSFIKLLVQEREKATLFQWTFGTIATLFCAWTIYETSVKVLAIASLFVLSGLPVYLLWYRRKSSI